MDGPSDFKRPRYDSIAVGKTLLVGLYEHDSKHHQEWVSQNIEIFENHVKKDEASFASIMIVAHKTLTVKANLYTGNIILELKSTRPKDPELPLARSNFVMRLTLDEWTGFQANIPWIQAFIEKVQAGLGAGPQITWSGRGETRISRLRKEGHG